MVKVPRGGVPREKEGTSIIISVFTWIIIGASAGWLALIYPGPRAVMTLIKT